MEKRKHSEMRSGCVIEPLTKLQKTEISETVLELETSKNCSDPIDQHYQLPLNFKKLSQILSKKKFTFKSNKKSQLQFSQTKDLEYCKAYFQVIINCFETKRNKYKKQKKTPANSRKLIQISSNPDEDKIYQSYCKGFRTDYILTFFKISKIYFDKIINKKKNLELKKTNKQKFGQEHIDYILSFFNTKSIKCGLSNLKEIKVKFYKRFGITISLATIRRIIQKNGITRKRRIRLIYARNSAKTLDKRFEFALKYQQILASSYRLIFIDETGFNLASNSNYGYSKKGQLCYIHGPPKSSTISMISAIDNESIVLSMFFDGPIKSEDFMYFLFCLRNKLMSQSYTEENYVLLWDNCRTHYCKNAEKVENFFNIQRFPPYSCNLNPIELLFGWIKAQLKFKFFTSKTQLIKEIVKVLKLAKASMIQNFNLHCLRYYIKALDKEKFLN